MRTAPTIIALMLAVTVQGQTREQVLAEIQRQGIPHAHIVLAQARLETGNFSSDRCRRDHNLFGIKHNGQYARYRTWQDSVADYKARISSRYRGGDYYAFLRRIGYASDPAYTAKLKRF
jgi:flagellum-specific peptidoglycan hydrolase FlgJ